MQSEITYHSVQFSTLAPNIIQCYSKLYTKVCIVSVLVPIHIKRKGMKAKKIK